MALVQPAELDATGDLMAAEPGLHQLRGGHEAVLPARHHQEPSLSRHDCILDVPPTAADAVLPP
jgi:hypothetical protein